VEGGRQPYPDDTILRMAPELEKEIIIGTLSTFFGAFFTGIPAFLLFWWTWQRDQERLVVQKLLSFAETVNGGRVRLRDGDGPILDILVRNRSLFPVRISAAGFEVDGKVIQLQHPSAPMPMRKDPDHGASRPYVVNADDDPWELASQRRMVISVTDRTDRNGLGDALRAAAETRHVSEDCVLLSSSVAALVALESGKIFTSLPLGKRIWRRVLRVGRRAVGSAQMFIPSL